MPRADVFAAILFALRIQSAYATAFQVEKTFINGTVRYGVRKGASSFDVVNFCSSPSRHVRGTERGLLVRLRRLLQFSAISRTRHRRLPSGIGTKQTADGVTCQKSINKVSTMCRPSVYGSGTLNGTLMVWFGIDLFEFGNLNSTMYNLGRSK